jgi:hypothetical protein
MKEKKKDERKKGMRVRDGGRRRAVDANSQSGPSKPPS